MHLISRIHCTSLFVGNVDKKVRLMTDWLLVYQAMYLHPKKYFETVAYLCGEIRPRPHLWPKNQFWPYKK